jgi:hypothetical protein
VAAPPLRVRLRERTRALGSQLTMTSAELAGKTLRSLPGYLGAGAIVYGAGQVWPPLAWFVGGAFLMILDRRMP